VAHAVLRDDADRHLALAEGLVEHLDHALGQAEQLDRQAAGFEHGLDELREHIARAGQVLGLGALRHLRHGEGLHLARDRQVVEAFAFVGLRAGADRAVAHHGRRPARPPQASA